MLRPTLFLLTIGFTLGCYPAFGQSTGISGTQPIQITGYLRYANGSPATEIVVHLERFSGGIVADVRTDHLGKFRFTGLSPLQYQVVIHHPGYRNIAREVNLVMVTAENLQLELIPDGTEMGNKPPPSSSKVVLDASVPPEARKEFEKAEAILATEKKGKTEEGILHLQKALTLYPNFFEAQLKLGAAYMDLQQFEKAEQALKETLEIEPKIANAFFALGEIYLRQKKDEEAEKVLLRGLQIEDRSYEGHLTLAHVYVDMASKIKDEAPARPYLEKAYSQVNQSLKLNPNLAQAHLVKGNLLLRVRRASDAQHEYEEYLRLEPKGLFADQTRTTVEKIKQALKSEKKS